MQPQIAARVAASTTQTVAEEQPSSEVASLGERAASGDLPAGAASRYPRIARRTPGPSWVVEVDTVTIGGGSPPVIMAGPCSVETREQILLAAEQARQAGAQILRGGAFKPRTSPYGFQGLGWEGIRLLLEAGRQVGLPVVTEILDPRDVDRLLECGVAMLQIGSRNMQNYPLLAAVGRTQCPVLLKRGLAATIEELLLAAERIACGGNTHIVLCERGIRSFDAEATRNVLDVVAVPVLHEKCQLPVVVDPSHASGRRQYVPHAARSAIAAGADGLLIEMHPSPDHSLTDADQAIDAPTLERIVSDARTMTTALVEHYTASELRDIRACQRSANGY